jgi:hypothetical protein
MHEPRQSYAGGCTINLASRGSMTPGDIRDRSLRSLGEMMDRRHLARFVRGLPDLFRGTIAGACVQDTSRHAKVMMCTETTALRPRLWRRERA